MDSSKSGEDSNQSLSWFLKHKKEIICGFLMFVLFLMTVLFFSRNLGFEFPSPEIQEIPVLLALPPPGEVLHEEVIEENQNVEDVWGALHEEVQEPPLPPEECDRAY